MQPNKKPLLCKKFLMKQLALYNKLFSHFGCQHWWPVSDSGLMASYKKRKKLSENQKLEIALGAILAQNTSWKNVQKAVLELKKAEMLSLEKIAKASKPRLAKLIRSSGYFNQKADYLKVFCSNILTNYKSLNSFYKKPLPELRTELLSLKGIGKETADSILLYSAQKPIFMIDLYTQRILERVYGKEFDYDSAQQFFESNLSKNVELFNEFHALLVRFAQEFCRKKPLCGNCFLKKECIKFNRE